MTDREAYDAFNEWSAKDEKRVCHEWSKWDGTEQDGLAINDRQCERIMSARAKFGIDAAMMGRFRAMEKQCKTTAIQSWLPTSP